MDPIETPPAACQGAFAITARANDTRTLDALAKCEDTNARIEIEAERAFLEALDGSCRTPIGALARVNGANCALSAKTLTPDGTATLAAYGKPLRIGQRCDCASARRWARSWAAKFATRRATQS
jgi:porphobilinogen deaminase